jgi:hypothetical protein
MPDHYERAVDDLLAAIRTHLQHQYDREPTDPEIAAYIERTDPATIRQNLQQYPECQTAARYLNRGRTNTTHVLYVMLWGRVNDWLTTEGSDNATTDSSSTDSHIDGRNERLDYVITE